MYILTEQVMNGTFTISTRAILVDAPDFQSAKDKLKKIFEERSISTEICDDNDTIFTYTIVGQDYPIWSFMRNEEPTVIG